MIRPIADLIETDMSWDYLNLQAEIGQNYREKYGSDEVNQIETESKNWWDKTDMLNLFISLLIT